MQLEAENSQELMSVSCHFGSASAEHIQIHIILLPASVSKANTQHTRSLELFM